MLDRNLRNQINLAFARPLKVLATGFKELLSQKVNKEKKCGKGKKI